MKGLTSPFDLSVHVSPLSLVYLLVPIKQIDNVDFVKEHLLRRVLYMEMVVCIYCDDLIIW